MNATPPSVLSRARFKALLERGDALSPRERVILFVLLLALIWALIDIGLAAPLDRAWQAEKARMQGATERIREAEAALAQSTGAASPDHAARQRLLYARTALDGELRAAESARARLIAPRDMLRVLHEITRRQPGVTLLSLNTLPPEPVFAAPARDASDSGQAAAKGAGKDEAKDAAPAPADAPVGYYRHGVELVVQGDYAALVSYMEALERNNSGFLWARATLDASHHPALALTLRINTLGTEAQWLTL